MRWLAGGLALLAAVLAALWWAAGRAAPPAIQIQQPTTVIGQSSPVEITVTTPGGKVSRLAVTLEQGGRSFVIVDPGAGTPYAQRSGFSVDRDRLTMSARAGKKEFGDLRPGPARLVVQVARSVYGLRSVGTEATRDV